MAYCRWSSAGGMCDVYAYETEFGIYIHLARVRPVGGYPPYPSLSLSQEEWREAMVKRNELMRNLEYETIDLPYMGETFIVPDAEECYAKLRELQRLGYLIPDYTFQTLREEMLEHG